ncbi:MAG: hypothetical protein ACOC29_00630, partial [Candidatus Sumerlaeota bacterium]
MPGDAGGAGDTVDFLVDDPLAMPEYNQFTLGEERAADVLPYFRIGYLRPAMESPMNRRFFQGLEQALMDDQAIRDELLRMQMRGIVLRPCDTPDDMLQRLGLLEFDLVYAPAMVYARHRLYKPEEYSAVLMLRERVPRAGSIRPRSDASGSYPRRRGALFMRIGSEVEQAVRSHNDRRIREVLTSDRLYFAVSSPYDAAGYLYGLKLVSEEFQGAEPAQLLYCGSPQEVVKAVVSGLAEIGVCEENILDEVLATIPGDGFRTDL